MMISYKVVCCHCTYIHANSRSVQPWLHSDFPNRFSMRGWIFLNFKGFFFLLSDFLGFFTNCRIFFKDFWRIFFDYGAVYEIFPSTEISFFLDRTNYLSETYHFLIGCDFNVNFVQVYLYLYLRVNLLIFMYQSMQKLKSKTLTQNIHMK